MVKYEIEKVTYADESEVFYILADGDRMSTYLGSFYRTQNIEEARRYVKSLQNREASTTEISKEIVE